MLLFFLVYDPLFVRNTYVIELTSYIEKTIELQMNNIEILFNASPGLAGRAISDSNFT